MSVKPIPEGYHTITPYLSIRGVPRLIEFLKMAFGAEECSRHVKPDGSIMNAEVKIGDSKVMMGEVPKEHNPMPAMIYLYVTDVDAVYKRAIQAGGKSVLEPMDQFYGDRTGAINDESGNQWWIATRKEEVSPAQMIERATQKKYQC
jgi:PhnB protein